MEARSEGNRKLLVMSFKDIDTSYVYSGIKRRPSILIQRFHPRKFVKVLMPMSAETNEIATGQGQSKVVEEESFHKS